MASADDDVLGLLDHAWDRLHARMQGLTDEEWAWRPAAGLAEVSVRWRLDHLTQMLAEQRNWAWLGSPDRPEAMATASGAAEALQAVATAYAALRTLVPATDLSAEIGPAAGRYGDATRRSFVLHLADELVHHAAEAALLRDLYGARPT